MTITPTPIEGLIVLTPRIFNDDRGYFFESFNERTFWDAVGVKIQFVQDNESFSTKGVLRGLHLQKGEHAQTKLVRVIQGEVLDVAVDLRKNSPTYGQHYSVVLTADNHQQFLIPKGFAHGFVTLEDETEVLYKVSDLYSPAHDRAIRFDDPAVGIAWPVDPTSITVSEKDRTAPLLAEIDPEL